MRSPTRECAVVAPMLTAREGELSAEERALADAHLAGCDPCRALAADLAATDGLVRDALLAEAAKRDFAPFVDAVMDRVRASTPAPAGAYAQHERPSGRARAGEEPVRAERSAPQRVPGRGREGILDSLLAWARGHRAVAALAPSLAALALIVYLASAGPAAPRPGEVEVVAEGLVPMVLETAEGPVVLLADPEPTGT